MKNSLYYIVIFAIILPSPLFANGVGVVTGFPIPRFVSTKSNKSNVRIGPDTKYPVQFILKQKVPLKILDEYKNWRQIEDWDGDQGWIHKSLLIGELRAIVIVPIANIYENTNSNSHIIAKAEKHVILPIKKCSDTWCNITIPSIKKQGYIQKKNIWGNNN